MSPWRSAASAKRAPRLILALISALIGALMGLSSPAWALNYAESTPSGPGFPQWDGGDTGLRFADVNADGHVDFLSIGDHGSPYINTDQHGIMVYFGDGSGGWSIHMEGNFGYGGIAVGDANNDGLLDVGYGMHHNYSGSDLGDQLIEVALGDGTGRSWTPWDDGLATNGEDWGMFATDFADIDSDGDLDLASGSFGCCNGVHVYRNEGDGTWTQTWAMSGGNSDSQLCFGDVTNDGLPDIAAAYQHGTVFVNNGDGTFNQADTGLPAASSIGRPGVSLGDVDGDGSADLSFVKDGGVHVYVWRGDHWESFSAGLPVTGDYAITLLRDMDVDGWMDVIALGDGILTIWLGDGAGNWTEGAGITHSPVTATAALEAGGDIDHNGYPDLVFVQREGSWPSDRNALHVYRETSVPGERWVAVQFPRGSERLVAGSVQTIRWLAAQLAVEPAAISIELSLNGVGGPWIPIASEIPNSGHHQWTVPGPASEEAVIRVTMVEGGQSVSAMSGLFRILPGATTGIPMADVRSSTVPRLTILGNPVQGRTARVRFEGQARESGEPWLLSVYSPSGRLVRSFELGGTELEWDLTGPAGRRLSPGVYLLVLSGAAPERFADRQSLVVLR